MEQEALLSPKAAFGLRLLGLALALWLTVPAVLHQPHFYLLDNVNLIFHEAGHVLLSWGGHKLMLLGGSLFQVLMPLACMAAFLLRRDRYAAGLMLLWGAESMANVSAYIADAPTRNLDLITGDPDTHDWWQLLNDNLGAAAGLSRLVLSAAIIALVAGVLLAVWDDLGGLAKE